MVVISAAPPETAAVLIPELLVYPGTSIPTTYNIYELSVSNEAAVATTAEPPEVAAFAAEPPEVVAFAAEPPEVVAFAAEPPEVVAFAEPPEVAAFAAEPPEAVVLYTSAPLKTGVPTYEHFFCPDEVIETVSESPVIHSQPKGHSWTLCLHCPSQGGRSCALCFPTMAIKADPELGTAYELSACPVMIKGTAYELSACPVMAIEAIGKLSVCPDTAKEAFLNPQSVLFWPRKSILWLSYLDKEGQSQTLYLPCNDQGGCFWTLWLYSHDQKSFPGLSARPVIAKDAVSELSAGPVTTAEAIVNLCALCYSSAWSAMLIGSTVVVFCPALMVFCSARSVCSTVGIFNPIYCGLPLEGTPSLNFTIHPGLHFP